MSRGPNMSYCAFENTSNAIRQLIIMVQESYEDNMTFGDLVQSRSSQDERRAVREIAELAQELIDAITDLDNNIVDDVDLDSELEES
jgi:hypothetical protein